MRKLLWVVTLMAVYLCCSDTGTNPDSHRNLLSDNLVGYWALMAEYNEKYRSLDDSLFTDSTSWSLTDFEELVILTPDSAILCESGYGNCSRCEVNSWSFRRDTLILDDGVEKEAHHIQVDGDRLVATYFMKMGEDYGLMRRHFRRLDQTGLPAHWPGQCGADTVFIPDTPVPQPDDTLPSGDTTGPTPTDPLPFGSWIIRSEFETRTLAESTVEETLDVNHMDDAYFAVDIAPRRMLVAFTDSSMCLVDTIFLDSVGDEMIVSTEYGFSLHYEAGTHGAMNLVETERMGDTLYRYITVMERVTSFPPASWSCPGDGSGGGQEPTPPTGPVSLDTLTGKWVAVKEYRRNDDGTVDTLLYVPDSAENAYDITADTITHHSRSMFCAQIGPFPMPIDAVPIMIMDLERGAYGLPVWQDGALCVKSLGDGDQMGEGDLVFVLARYDGELPLPRWAEDCSAGGMPKRNAAGGTVRRPHGLIARLLRAVGY